MLTMPADLLREVDAVAREMGRKRSQLVRDALNELIARRRAAQFEEMLAAGYLETTPVAREWVEDTASALPMSASDVWRWDD